MKGGPSPGHELDFPWRDGNRFTLLSGSEAFLAPMLDAIETARDQILLELYLASDGVLCEAFLQALERAAARGVRIHTLFDAYGSLGLGRLSRLRLNQPPLHFALYHPLQAARPLHNLRRNHRKLLLIDHRIAFIGGFGIDDGYLATSPEHCWQEIMVATQGPLLEDWGRLFAATWQEASGTPLPPAQPPAAANVGNARGRLVAGWPRRQQPLRALLRAVRNARQRAWITTAYFIPTWKLRRTLRRAARRGVDVRLLLPGPINDHPAVRHAGQRYYSLLLRAGVRIFEYQPGFWHAKVSLCDQLVSIGSSNHDRWNLHWNLEANQEVDDTRFAAETEAVLRKQFDGCNEIQYAEWRRRGWRQRLREQLWGSVELWLERLGTMRKGAGRQ